MVIYPAIDLVDGKAVRLFKGDYAQMTVYSEDPASVAKDFQNAGAKHIHLVDLDGAKSGVPENLTTIRKIIAETDLFVEVGGGIRNLETVETYLNAGVNRVILGTAAVTDPAFLEAALAKYGEYEGLGLLKGAVVPMAGKLPEALKIPHMGWNALQTRPGSLLEAMDGQFVYFVHSYYAEGCEDSLSAVTDYGIPITAAVERGNIYGCQFHPEKSGNVGLSILRAFCEV